ncbi:MAG: hypothetical protein HY904_26285 [Deltaproteobacteria bacterium]|nr:hypothetical protein [Deltaproteobacteria bacterium]
MSSPVELDALLERRVLLVTGKGGVGKTSVSAALALAAVARGKKPLVVSCDGRPTVGRLLGPRDEGSAATDVGQGVWGMYIDFREALVDLIADMLGARRLVDAFLGNRVVRTFIHSAPSVMEMTLLHRMDRARSDQEPGGPFSPVIVDLPASGHALALLSTPRAVMRLVRVGPLYRRAVELLRLTHDAKQTALVVVTLAEELPINETIELVTRARDLNVPVGHVVVNAVPHLPMHPEDVALLGNLRETGPEPLRQWVGETLAGSERGARAHAEIERLKGAAQGAVTEVPFVKESGTDLAGTISRSLRR